jgi:hypothetical protein
VAVFSFCDDHRIVEVSALARITWLEFRLISDTTATRGGQVRRQVLRVLKRTELFVSLLPKITVGPSL